MSRPPWPNDNTVFRVTGSGITAYRYVEGGGTRDEPVSIIVCPKRETRSMPWGNKGGSPPAFTCKFQACKPAMEYLPGVLPPVHQMASIVCNNDLTKGTGFRLVQIIPPGDRCVFRFPKQGGTDIPVAHDGDALTGIAPCRIVDCFCCAVNAVSKGFAAGNRGEKQAIFVATSPPCPCSVRIIVSRSVTWGIYRPAGGGTVFIN